MRSDRRWRTRASSPAEDPANNVAQLEQLLAHHIGPMAKVVLPRALKKSCDDDELVRILALNIDDESERAIFLVAAARVVVTTRPRTEPASAPSVGMPASAPSESAGVTPPSNAMPDASSQGIARELDSDAAIGTGHPRAPGGESGSMKAGAIFLSYARENLADAQRVADALRAAGLEVWLDLGKLQPGDAWDLKIRRNIEACSFFVPLVSRETEARQEGYFRREWNIAADRSMNFADDVPFILPVTIDDTAAYKARVPERFRRAHWISLPQGEVTRELVDCLRQLVEDSRSNA